MELVGTPKRAGEGRDLERLDVGAVLPEGHDYR
jgi:hypothetical protein